MSDSRIACRETKPRARARIVGRLLYGWLIVIACARPQTAPHGSEGRRGPSEPPGSVPDERSPRHWELGTTVVPTGYEVELSTQHALDTFTGAVEITLQVSEVTNVLRLHAADLQIRDVRVEQSGASIEVALVKLDVETEQLVLNLDVPLLLGSALLKIEYEGRYGQQYGVFRTSALRYTFTTFEPTGARRAFPCFDDPRFPAPWKLSLRVAADEEAFSNAPVARISSGDDGTRVFEFGRTDPMPPYLVAFATGPFETIPTSDPRIRLIVPQESRDRAEWAAPEAPPLVKMVEDFFGEAIPVPKLDLVAIPGFRLGGMENPGLITIRQDLLVPSHTPAMIQYPDPYRAILLHEVVHAWYGYLITPRWWEDVWFNEAVAKWVAHKLLEANEPNGVPVVSELLEYALVMGREASSGARPIREQPTSFADFSKSWMLPELDQQALSWEKGAAVLEMLARWLGPNRMRDALRAVVRETRGGQLSTAAFAARLSRALNRDIRGIVSSYADQPGIPIVHSTLVCSEDRARLQLHQRPFGEDLSNSLDSRIWRIPVCVRSSNGRACTLLTKVRGTLELGGTCPDWVYPNAAGAGVYRFTLSSSLMERLYRNLGSLSRRERAALADNLLALVADGQLTPARADMLLSSAENDDLTYHISLLRASVQSPYH